MSRRRILVVAMAVIFFAVLVVQFIHLARREWHHAVQQHVYTKMQVISGAMQQYRGDHTTYPSSLSKLCPTYLPNDLLRDRLFHDWFSRRTIVPEFPYGFRLDGTNLFITCRFSGPMCTQIVFACASGEVSPE